MNQLPDPERGLEVKVELVRDLAPAITSGEIRLIDCREFDEWQFNRLPGAKLAPLSVFEREARRLAETKEPCIIYCHHGMRSLRAASMLRAVGLEEAWSMRGGIDEWSDRIDPTVPKY